MVHQVEWADHVFGPQSHTSEVYEHVAKNIISSATRGFNGTRLYSCTANTHATATPSAPL
jgi:hypothetical protein